LLIRFWGVRGSISAPGPSTVRYGGNTPCLEVATDGGEALVVDAGYGVVGLGEELQARAAGRSQTIHLALTHLHWDHIQGIPFFAPIYVPGNRIVVHSASEQTAREAMELLFTSDYSPIMGVGNLGATIEYRELGAGFELGQLRITPLPLRHSVPTMGLRITDGRKVLVHATDHEAKDREADAPLIAAATGADLLIHDAFFTAEEHARSQGWGHSDIDSAVATACAAAVQRLMLFHYNPVHTDAQLDAHLEQARTLAAGSGVEVSAAAEGMSIDL